MSKIKILTDSCSDLGKALRDKYDIDYIQMYVNWDGKELPASTDWDVYTQKELYDALRAGKRITTTQISVTTFEQVFTKYVEDGYDIVYIACPRALSGSVSTGETVARSIMEKYVGSKIFCVDAVNTCGAEALITIEAAKFAKTAQSVEDVVEFVNKIKHHAIQTCTVDTLDYFKRAGRVKAAAAFFGNLFGIKPIVISDEVGNNVALKKVKGKANAVDECINMLKKGMVDPEYPASEQTVYIGHADDIATAEYMAEKVKELIGPKDIIINDIGPIIGATAGPGTVALFAFGDPAIAYGK